MAVQKGCHSITNTNAVLYRIVGPEIVDGRFRAEQCLSLIDGSDAVIFGSPTYMGGPAAQFKAFADATSDHWDAQQWADKVAAGFTVGANPNGDQLMTLQYFSILASQHGMLWIGLDIPGGFDERQRNPLGSQLGLACHCLTPVPPVKDLEMYLKHDF